MKKTKMIMLVAAMTLAAACSSSDDESQKQSSQPESGWSEMITVTAGTPGNSGGSGSNGRLRVKVNTDNPQKSLWETGDQLTIWTMTGATCSTANMSVNGFTLIDGADTGTGKFSGRLKSESAPTSSTSLIAIIDNGSDAINASAGNSVSVDLSEQAGATAESALDYELFYATSTNATRNFTFTHKMALVKWTIKVNGASDGDQCDIVLSGTGLKNSATLDPATGTLTPGTDDGTITLKDVTLTSAASTELYVVLPPGTVSSGITATLTMKSGKSAVGSLGDGSSITLEANRYYTAGVNEFTPSVNDFSSLAPGDVIYANDGTTPVAVTVYQSGGHGYAIALEDCTTSNCSATASSGTNYFTWDAVTTNTCLGNNGSTYASAIADMNGKTNTSTLTGDGHTHNAATAASTYNVDIPSDAPSGAAWVLPSAGQWFQLMKTFGVSATDFAVGNQLTVTTSVFGWVNGNNNGAYYLNMNTNLKTKCSTFTDIAGDYYWSSSEYSSDFAVRVSFYSSNGFNVDYNLKVNDRRVRAFLAF